MPVKRKRIHFIAIGGSVMHNLAIALKRAGHEISGSDDEIFEPSRSVLARHGLLPEEEGWHPEKIDRSIDIILLGMHARADNPELIKARELGLPIMSFPDFIYENSKDKQRVVIAGSHGKTTITSIIVHVLNFHNRLFDYVIGAKVKGIEYTVQLSDAPVIIIEGDEYLSSALDPTPKFLRYQHHIGLVSGIAWDHANVFPTEEDYIRQFDRFADQTPPGGSLYFSKQDQLADTICSKDRTGITCFGYEPHPVKVQDGKVYLVSEGAAYPIKVFGQHNYLNISGAKQILKCIGITDDQFYEAISSFEGASGRLEKIFEDQSYTVYKDFAHAPSKVKASVDAVKHVYPDRALVACLELHTYSSLNRDFIPQYKGSMQQAQQSVVFYNPDTVRAKKLPPLNDDLIRKAFDSPQLEIFSNANELADFLYSQSWKNKNLLMMSSGNFGNLNLKTLAENLKA